MSFLAFLCFFFHTCDAAEVMKGKYDAVGRLLFELTVKVSTLAEGSVRLKMLGG